MNAFNVLQCIVQRTMTNKKVQEQDENVVFEIIQENKQLDVELCGICGISSLVLTLSDSSRNSKSQSSPESRSKGLQLQDVVSEDVQREMFYFLVQECDLATIHFRNTYVELCGIMWNKGNVSYLAVSKITADEWECQHQNLRPIASKCSGNFIKQQRSATNGLWG